MADTTDGQLRFYICLKEVQLTICPYMLLKTKSQLIILNNVFLILTYMD